MWNYLDYHVQFVFKNEIGLSWRMDIFRPASLRGLCTVARWRYCTVLTAGSFAQHLDASLCVALSFLQLTFVGVRGRIRAADRRHQGRTVPPLANAFSLGRVSWVSLAHGTKATQHSSTAWKTRRGADIRIDAHHIPSFKSSKLKSFHNPTADTLMSAIPHELIMHAQSFPPSLPSWRSLTCVNAKKVETPDAPDETRLDKLISICVSHRGLWAELYSVQQHKCIRDSMWSRRKAHRCSQFIQEESVHPCRAGTVCRCVCWASRTSLEKLQPWKFESQQQYWNQSTGTRRLVDSLFWPSDVSLKRQWSGTVQEAMGGQQRKDKAKVSGTHFKAPWVKQTQLWGLWSSTSRWVLGFDQVWNSKL